MRDATDSEESAYRAVLGWVQREDRDDLDEWDYYDILVDFTTVTLTDAIRAGLMTDPAAFMAEVLAKVTDDQG